MKLELDSLRIRHARLPAEIANDLRLHAAVALQRHHVPGVSIQAVVLVDSHVFPLTWSLCSAADSEQVDNNRATEFGAEAIALSLVHATQGWVVRRRLQRGEYADWLMISPSGENVALEVSGTDRDDAEGRMREKLQQVANCVAASTRMACVVRFESPSAAVEQSLYVSRTG